MRQIIAIGSRNIKRGRKSRTALESSRWPVPLEIVTSFLLPNIWIISSLLPKNPILTNPKLTIHWMWITEKRVKGYRAGLPRRVRNDWEIKRRSIQRRSLGRSKGNRRLESWVPVVGRGRAVIPLPRRIKRGDTAKKRHGYILATIITMHRTIVDIKMWLLHFHRWIRMIAALTATTMTAMIRHSPRISLSYLVRIWMWKSFPSQRIKERSCLG
mmetsp:Transcript_24942/g.44900  ORF Transcript_24942/g.44900 Transcript_24942/m.44900 type:complete len:214 (+) Transcript_24942:101-742(+)